MALSVNSKFALQSSIEDKFGLAVMVVVALIAAASWVGRSHQKLATWAQCSVNLSINVAAKSSLGNDPPQVPGKRSMENAGVFVVVHSMQVVGSPTNLHHWRMAWDMRNLAKW